MHRYVLGKFEFDYNKLPSRIAKKVNKCAELIFKISKINLSEDNLKEFYELKLPPFYKKNGKKYLNDFSKTRYSEQVLNNIANSFNSALKEYSENKYVPITISKMCEYNAKLLKEEKVSNDFEIGKLRKCGTKVGNYVAPHYKAVPLLLAELVRWVEEKNELLSKKELLAENILKALVVQLYLLLIHPFGDANGRVARLIEYVMLLNAGVPSFLAQEMNNFYNETRKHYHKKLHYLEKKGDIYSFLEYAAKGFYKKLKIKYELCKLKSKKDSISLQYKDFILNKHNYYKVYISKQRTNILRYLIQNKNTPEPIVNILKAGFTMIELVLVIAILAVLAVTALPNIFNISLSTARDNSESAVVAAVQTGVYLYAVNQCASGGSCPDYPAELDSATTGTCDVTNICFGNVLQGGLSIGGWEKIDTITYRAPSGNEYEYNETDGTFLYSGS